ncbi:MAG: HepT-like ribonuclease domain-containing protein [bacterium]
MRNLMIHDYDDVDLQIVWRTVQHDLPALIAQLEPLLPPEEL